MSTLRFHKRQVVGLVLVAAATMACQSGLTSGEWQWCKDNLPAVDIAADNLGLPRSDLTFQEPSWWAAYTQGKLNQSLAWTQTDAAFQSSCFAAAATRGVVEDGRIPWCISDGLGETWGESIAQGHMVEVTANTFAYRAVPLQQRLDNEDFKGACRAAYAAR